MASTFAVMGRGVRSNANRLPSFCQMTSVVSPRAFAFTNTSCGVTSSASAISALPMETPTTGVGLSMINDLPAVTTWIARRIPRVGRLRVSHSRITDPDAGLSVHTAGIAPPSHRIASAAGNPDGLLPMNLHAPRNLRLIHALVRFDGRGYHRGSLRAATSGFKSDVIEKSSEKTITFFPGPGYTAILKRCTRR